MNALMKQVDPAVQMVAENYTNVHTQDAYGRAVAFFVEWAEQAGVRKLDRQSVTQWRNWMMGQQYAPNTINQRLAAVKGLARELYAQERLPHPILVGIQDVKGIGMRGELVGHWLSLEESQKILNMPDTRTLQGLRDKVVLALMLFCGLRRDEVARLQVSHLRQIQGKWVIANLHGKHGRVRSIKLPIKVKQLIDTWLSKAGIVDGCIIREVNKGKNVWGEGITGTAVYNIVTHYALKSGLEFSPHDLRRTSARLMYECGVTMAQIQLVLGHSSITTTEKYIAVQFDVSSQDTERIPLEV